MPSRTKSQCASQFARERRLSVYPHDFGIEQDVCDVTLWILEKFRVPSVHLWVDRHYFHVGRQISGVTAMMFHKHPDQLTPAAREAFLAFGYEINDTGADIYALQFCNGNHSKHEALQAFGRTEAALKDCRASR